MENSAEDSLNNSMDVDSQQVSAELQTGSIEKKRFEVKKVLFTLLLLSNYSHL
jgi:hypothetical protein